MNQLRPYLFWIVAGVLVLIELILILAVTPSINGKSPEDVKHDVDAQQKQIDKLYQQATAGAPKRIFDPLDPTDMKQLLSNWLVTPAWQQPLDDELSAFGTQMRLIRDHLVRRSEGLHTPISNSTEGVDWYATYATKTADLLKGLKDADCLILPVRRSTAVGPPPGVTQPTGSGSGSAGVTASEDSGPNYKTDEGVRSLAGFFTMKGDYPESERFAAYTTEYRVMAMIARVLETCKGTNEPSPIAPQKKPFEETAKLTKASFENESDEVIVVDLQLQGTLSALLAAEAGFEENKDETEAVRVVLGGKLGQKPYVNGEHLHTPSESATLELHVAFLDFGNLKNEAVDVLPVHQSAPPPGARPQNRPRPHVGSGSKDQGD